MAGVDIFVLIVFGFCACYSSAHSSSEIHQQAEVYTVWPRDNVTNLSEGFPWPLCSNVTGENCPGLMDWLEHLCTRDVGPTCDVGNGSLSDRSVVLKLRPGVHVFQVYALSEKKRGRLNFKLDPAKFWLCSFSSLTIKGDSGSTPVLLAQDKNVSHTRIALRKSGKQNKKCETTFDWPSADQLRAALAFHGGGRLLLENLRIQSNFRSKGGKVQPQHFFALWDVQNYEVAGCTFHLGFGHGAIISIHSKDVASFKATVRECDINMTFDARDLPMQRGVPALMALSASTTSTNFRPKVNVCRLSAPRKITIERCAFLVNYPFGLSYA